MTETKRRFNDNRALLEVIKKIFTPLLMMNKLIMTLQIFKKNEIFYLNGKLNSSTLKSFTTYFEYNLSQNKNVTINIDKVKAIDASGVEALKTLTAISLKNNSIFDIIGKGCKDIYAHNNRAFAA